MRLSSPKWLETRMGQAIRGLSSVGLMHALRPERPALGLNARAAS